MSPLWTWTILAFIGTLMALYGAWDAYRDLHAWGRPEPNGARQLAVSALRGQLLRALGLGLWMGIGAVLLWNDAYVPWSPTVTVLVVANAVFSLNAALDAKDRRAIRRALEAQQS